MKENNSTVYFPYGKLFCRVHLYNFLYRNYNLENVLIEAKFFELNGKLIKKENYHLKDDESIILDSKQMNFKRDITIKFSLKNDKQIKGIIRSFCDYYNDDVITCVHEQGAFWSSGIDVVAQGNMKVCNKKNIDTFALIQNTHFEKKEIKFDIKVFNSQGESFLLKGEKLKYNEFCKFKVNTKKVKEFLQNDEGSFVIEYANYIGRAAYIYLSNKAKFASVSHATYYACDKRPHTTKDYYDGDNLTIQSFVFLNNYNGYSSKINLFNDYEEEKIYDVELFDKNGNFIKKYKNIITLKHNQTKSITPELLDIKDNFIGSIKVTVYFKDNNPLFENSNYIIYTQDSMADSAIEFIPYLNNYHNELKSYERNSLLEGTLHRSRQFCRGIENNTYESYLIISFSSISNKKYNTQSKITFISQDGLNSISKYITFTTNTPFFEKISSILSIEEQKFIGEHFSIYIRDPKNKIVSLILVKNKSTKDIGMDHFVGA